MKRLIKPTIEYNDIYAMAIYDTSMRSIMAASAREITENMIRVKSSNLWSYAIDVKEMGDDEGDIYVQFKGRDGGPGDIYVYYDVPLRIYQKWLSAPSKGHYFWVWIRNKYLYRKLTGDKRTKLKNGLN